MKKFFLSFFALALFCFYGCSKPATSSWYREDGKLKVLSTTAMINALVKEVGGEYIDPLTLIIGEVDPHSYELVKGDDEKISRAAILFGNGLNLEHGASLNYQLSHHPYPVLIGNEIQKKVPERILNGEGEIDPHVWMDISLWAEGIDSIVKALSLKDPLHQEAYKQNGKELKTKLLTAHREIKTDLQQIPSEKRFLVTSHDAFHYFTFAYLAEEEKWKERCVAPEGLAPEGQLSSLDIQRVIDHLSKYQIGVVFPESNVSRDALKKITSACSHPVKICQEPLYGDAMGLPGSGADAYVEMIRHNAQVLKKAWSHD